jgi:SPX domain protein involved in polyphosphate accumulation
MTGAFGTTLNQGMIIPSDRESRTTLDSSLVSLAKESNDGGVWVVEEREEYRRGDVGAKRIMHASRDLDLQSLGDRPLGINSASSVNMLNV